MIKLDDNSRMCLGIGVIGSKNFKDSDLIHAWLDRLNKELGPFDKIVIGGIGGTDSSAQKWAKNNQIEIKFHYADWSTYGKKAIYVRNILIVDNSDILVVFWDGDSKDSAHAIRIARASNKHLLVISERGEINEILSNIKLSD
jgi:hypothetical protein